MTFGPQLRLAGALVVAVGFFAAPAAAQSSPSPLTAVYDCADIADGEARLACFDAAVNALRTGEEDGSIVAVSRDDIVAAEEASFGLSIPNFRIPGLSGLARGGRDDTSLADAANSAGLGDGAVVERSDDGGIRRVTGLRIADIRRRGDGHHVFTLENGQVWMQVDGGRVNVPRNLDEATATIRTGAVGSFMMRINDSGPSIRIRRVQ